MTPEPDILLDDGINVEQFQETREVYKVRLRSRTARVRFTNTNGRLRIMTVKLEGKTAYMRGGTFA